MPRANYALRMAWARFCLLTVLVLPVQAALNVWTQGGGVYGGLAYTLVCDAHGILYLGTIADNGGNASGGLFKSSDGGLHWLPVTTLPIARGNVFNLTIAPDGNLYAATAGGMFRTSDGAASWTKLSISGGNLAFDAKGNIYAQDGLYIHKSSDGGANWVQINEGISAFAILTSIAVAPDDSLYVGAGMTTEYLGGAYTSRNGGANWTAVNNGLVVGGIRSLLTDHAGNVYGGSLGVYKTTDGGKQWLSSGLADQGGVDALTMDAGGAIYAATTSGIAKGGLFKSLDGGVSWRASLNTSRPIKEITLSPNGNVYTTTFAGNVVRYTASELGLPFSLSASVSGSNAALKLDANLSVAAEDAGKRGNLYIIAVLADGAVYQLSGQGWSAFRQMPLTPYATTTLNSHTLKVLDGVMDVSSLQGAVIYAGYGRDLDDMLVNNKYAPFYVIQ